MESQTAELIAAIQERRFDDARRLIDSGCDTRVADADGLTPVDHALLSGDAALFRDISRANRARNVAAMLERLPGLCAHFASIPDFRIRFRWRVYSWLPFITAFCPSDVWTLTKVGRRMRIDSTLANWSGFRFTRGSTSVFLDAGAAELLDAFVAVDNMSGERFSVLREVVESGDVDADIDSLMRMDLIKGRILMDSVRHSDARGWFGRRIGASVHDGRWNVAPSDLQSVKIEFAHVPCEEFGKEGTQPVKTVKTFSGRFWCCREFPIQVPMLVPFFEVLSPFRDTCRNILAILGMFSDGMPLKAVVNVFPTVKLEFEIVDYSDSTEEYAEYVELPPANGDCA